MTLQELHSLLLTTGYRVAYRAFPAPEPLPFLVYVVTGSNNVVADDRVYQTINHIQVELYTKYKDLDAEAKVEEALSELVWSKDENWINEEQCNMIIYEIEV